MSDQIAIKIGSNVLTSVEGMINMERIEHLTDQMAILYKQGKDILLISSGAVAAGRSMVRFRRKVDPVTERQVLSSTGQARLMSIYGDLFEKKGIPIAQVLVTKEDFRTREHYLNMKNCISGLWQNGIVPIVNENDAISVTALMFTDNDELAGLLASMMNCKALYILSNVNGIYNGDPSNKESEVIKQISSSHTDLGRFISSSKSDFGRGGMLTKCRIAQKTAAGGVSVHIANGKTPDVLVKLNESVQSVVHTHFIPGDTRPAIKKWMAYSEGFAKAEIVINEGAFKALFSHKATSLLLPGIIEIRGDFLKGDLLRILTEDNTLIGIGKASYEKQKALARLGDRKFKPLIHYDYLYLFPV